MTGEIMHTLGFACAALAALGCVHALAAAARVRRFRIHGEPVLEVFPGVTILKPLHGAEAGLDENLASFCEQDYPGRVQIVFGAHDARDPAVRVVERLIAIHPGRDLELCITGASRGPNPKVANLTGMQPSIRHGIVVIADSDIAVPRDYLSRTVAALGAPGVGLVTYLYRGDVRGGIWARLAAMAIDYHFLPNVLIGLALGLARRSLFRAIRSPPSAVSTRLSHTSPTTTRSAKRFAAPAWRWRSHRSWSGTPAPSKVPANWCATNCAGPARCARRARGVMPVSR